MDQSMRALTVVLHDVAPATWPRYRDFVARLDALGGIPLTLLVVPDYHRRGSLEWDRAFVRAMEHRLMRGDELALHGYHHQDEGPPPRGAREYFMRRIYTREGEFHRLDHAEASIRLDRGLALFGRLGWPVQGFVAPAWLLGAAARSALADRPLRYTSDPGALYRLPGFVRLPAPALVWSARSAWRRQMSRPWNTLRLARSRDARLLRFGLHPVDMDHPTVAEWWWRILMALIEERTPLTKIAWLERQA